MDLQFWLLMSGTLATVFIGIAVYYSIKVAGKTFEMGPEVIVIKNFNSSPLQLNLKRRTPRKVTPSAFQETCKRLTIHDMYLPCESDSLSFQMELLSPRTKALEYCINTLSGQLVSARKEFAEEILNAIECILFHPLITSKLQLSCLETLLQEKTFEITENKIQKLKLPSVLRINEFLLNEMENPSGDLIFKGIKQAEKLVFRSIYKPVTQIAHQK